MSTYDHRVEAAVHALCRFYYVNVAMRNAWNRSRREGELRILCGWAWVERRGLRRTRGGFKSYGTAMRDGHYTVVAGLEFAPAHARRPAPGARLPDTEARPDDRPSP